MSRQENLKVISWILGKDYADTIASLQKHGAEDGGPGSGNFGHKGRPDQVGGSAKRGSGGGSATLHRQAQSVARARNDSIFQKSLGRALGRLPSGATIMSCSSDDPSQGLRKHDDGLWYFPDGKEGEGLTDKQLAMDMHFDDEGSFYRAATPEQSAGYDKAGEASKKSEPPKATKKQVRKGVFTYDMDIGSFEHTESGNTIKSLSDSMLSATYYDGHGWYIFKESSNPDEFPDEFQTGLGADADIRQVMQKMAQISQKDGVGPGKARLSNGKIYGHRVKQGHGFTDGTSTGTHLSADADVYTDDAGMSVYVQRGMDPSKQTLDIGKLMTCLQKIQPQIRQRAQNQIDVVDYANPMDPHWRKKYKDFKRSYAIGGKDRITIFGSTYHSYDYLVGAMAHEMGHGIDRKNGHISSTAQWTKAVESDRIVSGMDSPTTYGTNSPEQDLAESMKMYSTKHDWFKSKFPSRYKIIKRLLGG